MRKLPHLAVGLVLAMLAGAFLSKSVMSTTGQAVTGQPPTIQIDDMLRTIDLKALPIHDVKDPV